MGEARLVPDGDVLIGTLLQNRYLVERELGHGGFGIVYLARDRRLLSKPVVIKVLLEQPTADAWFQKKFRQEIEALSRIDHPGVVGALDMGETTDGKPYLVMQFVEGVTLKSAIGNRGVDLQRVANIMRQIGQALGAAHDKGVYHRDLTPENIMLQSLGEGEERLRLIDFGIATVKDSQVAAAGQTTRVAGNLAYMAPEQFEGKASAASDIYALGVIAYEMVTGKRPFGPESVMQFLEAQRRGPKFKPQELRSDLPEAAQDVILKALSFDPEDRYRRPREFGEELARALKEAAPQPAAASDISPSLEMAHVLVMDLVRYAASPVDEQTQMVRQLQEIVRGTVGFRRARASGQLLSLPAVGGMALVFFHSPEALLEAAIELAHVVRNHPQLTLRMGVHTGPVYRVADIHVNRSVAGGGIDQAQRVMDCGDAGHILVSKAVVDALGELTKWAECVHDLGEREVTPGQRIHLFNLYTSEAGNPQSPKKVGPRKQNLVLFEFVGSAALVAAVMIGAVLWLSRYL